jgi:hypothetical protein
MKISILMALLLAVLPLSMAWGDGLSTSHLTEPSLQDGQCHTVNESKMYLKDFKDPAKKGKYPAATTEIGEARINELNDSATESYFFCKVKCKIGNDNHFLWIAQKDRNENYKNINGFVCYGLDIQDVALSSTLTIKTTVSVPFSAVQSSFPEIHKVLKDHSYKLTGVLLGTMIVDFFKAFSAIQYAYAHTPNQNLHEASVLMEKYAPTQPEGWEMMKARAKLVDELNLTPEGIYKENMSPEDIVNIFFLTHGRFLIYVD